MTNTEQSLWVGNWLLDLLDVERQRSSWGGRVAAYAVGAGALALLGWSAHQLLGPDTRGAR